MWLKRLKKLASSRNFVASVILKAFLTLKSVLKKAGPDQRVALHLSERFSLAPQAHVDGRGTGQRFCIKHCPLGWV